MPTATQTLDISVNNLSVTYNNAKLALYNANCTVEPGTITALVGPNGSGKSTLFKSIMGFLKPTQGQIQVGGLPVQKAQKKQLMAYVPQSDEVDWNFPV
ncbi:MAG: ATP-binding cassette domain-containing protein, partial [Xenococcaceae cyanobacterium MO_188.B29]|nr:ATP-binding cassette domain-containing protein [Xenococcaceae cyanobacterium MO_188.B29]